MTQAAPPAVTSRDLTRVCAGDDDSDDDEERPMSRDELKAKTLRGMSKRCGLNPPFCNAPNAAFRFLFVHRVLRDGTRAAAAKGARRKDIKGRR